MNGCIAWGAFLGELEEARMSKEGIKTIGQIITALETISHVKVTEGGLQFDHKEEIPGYRFPSRGELSILPAGRTAKTKLVITLEIDESYETTYIKDRSPLSSWKGKPQ